MLYVRLAGYKKGSVADGPGVRTVVFFQGCRYACEGCQNPKTHSLTSGKLHSVEKLLKQIIADTPSRRVTFSGGEALLQPEALLWLAEELHKRGFDLCLYTGGAAEDIPAEILRNLNYVVDGRFVLNLRDVSLAFRGSSNQRVLKVVHKDNGFSFENYDRAA